MQQIAFSFLAETPQDILYGYGPLGVIVVVLAGVAWNFVRMFMKDRDRVIAQRDALLNDIFDKVIPAVNKNTDVLQRRQEIDVQLVSVLKESNEALERNTKSFDRVSEAYRFRRANDRDGGV